MAENIDGTTGGLSPYNTSIPSLAENADIQEALRLYHYGTKTPPADPANPSSTSVAGYIKTITTRVQAVENQGIGSGYHTVEPASVPNGYVWVDQSSEAPVFNNNGVPALSVARYQNDAPTGTIAEGSIWVDKNSSPLKMYVFDATSGWREIGA
jgi:hypothetical protein